MGFAMLRGQMRPISVTGPITTIRGNRDVSITIPSNGMYIVILSSAEEYSGHGNYCAAGFIIIDNFSIVGYSGVDSAYSENNAFDGTPSIKGSVVDFEHGNYSDTCVAALYKLAD